jgi:hypothetical protein
MTNKKLKMRKKNRVPTNLKRLRAEAKNKR